MSISFVFSTICLSTEDFYVDYSTCQHVELLNCWYHLFLSQMMKMFLILLIWSFISTPGKSEVKEEKPKPSAGKPNALKADASVAKSKPKIEVVKDEKRKADENDDDDDDDESEEDDSDGDEVSASTIVSYVCNFVVGMLVYVLIYPQ